MTETVLCGGMGAAASRTRSIIQTAFYGNRVLRLSSRQEAYPLARSSPGVVVTDLPVYRPEEQGLPGNARVLLCNDGAIVGRCAGARRIQGWPGVESDALDRIVMDAIYDVRKKVLYHSEVLIGRDPAFQVRAHLLLPAGEESLLYNWLLNFTPAPPEEDAGAPERQDIYLFADPQWAGAPGREAVCDPHRLAYFSTEGNCAALLGLRYFGEYKKAALTLAWAMANRQGYVACHGGVKSFTRDDGSRFTAAFFGLSGSGKSTLTHARHGGKYPRIQILHDDACIIDQRTGSSMALEPTYFDKTADYRGDGPESRYFLSLQNCGAKRDEQGRVVPVTQDIRNGNGRAIKSRFWSPDPVDRLDAPVDALFWLMRDPTLPPVLRLEGPALASAMGAALAAKRSSAEHLQKGTDLSALVVEPYANPFRAYPLGEDYLKFRDLIRERQAACYILNTGEYMGKKIPKELTLSLVEAIVEGRASFHPWGPFSDIAIWEQEGFVPDLADETYRARLRERMEERLRYVTGLEGGMDRLPPDAAEALRRVVEEMDAASPA